MKRTATTVVVATLLALAAVSARADQTNLVQNLTIQLAGFKQGGTTVNRNTTTIAVDKVIVGTQEIIQALGSVMSVSFSAEAQLFLITPLPQGDPMVVVRDGSLSTDVSPFFGHETISEAVGKSTANTKTGKYSGTSYSMQRFVLQDFPAYDALPLHYEVSGFTVDSFSNTASPGPRNEWDADVSGTGDSAGALLILKGTIRVQGNAIEVVPSAGGTS